MFDRLNSFIAGFGLERLRRLDVVDQFQSLEDDDGKREAPEWLKSLRAPFLECASMALLCNGGNASGDFRGIPLFQGDASRLKALAISHLPPWFPANYFPNLTHISLSFQKTDHLPHMQLLSLFSNTPMLEISHMSFVRCEDQEGVRPDAWLTPISLPRLRLMAFTICTDQILSLIPHLDIPSHALVRVNKATLSAAGPDALLRTISLLGPWTELDVREHSYEEVHFALQGTTSGVWLQSTHTRKDTSSPLWLNAVLTALPARATLTSCLLDFEGIDPPVLGAFLRDAYCLTNLRLRAFTGAENSWEAVTRATRAWCDALTPSGGAGAPTRPCPALRSLAVVSDMDRRFEYEDAIRAYARVMEHMLVAREEWGLPRLARVSLRPFTYDDEDSSDSRSEGSDYYSEQEEETQWLTEAAAPLRALESHVEELVVLEPRRGDAVGRFEVREMWDVEGEEKYWQLNEDHYAQFFGGDSSPYRRYYRASSIY